MRVTSLRSAAMAAAAVTAALAMLLGLTVTPARAAGSPCLECIFDGDPPPPPSGEAGSDADGIWASLTIGGDATGGKRYSKAGRVKVAARCWYRWWFTGQEYAAQWTNKEYQRALLQMPIEYRTEPLPNWEEYADKDAEHGGWYGPWCRADVDTAYVMAYIDSHPPRYFLRTEPRPNEAIDIDPDVLAEAAYEAMDLPKGTIRWNPSLEGTGATVVNFETWVWVEDAAQTASVRAEVDSGPWVQVDAAIKNVSIITEDDESATCGDSLGVPWTPGAAGTPCKIVFERSTAHLTAEDGRTLPTKTMTVTATWGATWTAWNGASGVLDDLPIQVSTEIPVAEIQTIVTRKGGSGGSAGATLPGGP